MNKKFCVICVSILVVFIIIIPIASCENLSQKLGISTKIEDDYLYSGEPFEGYTLFAPVWDGKTYLIDNDGNVYYNKWESEYTDAQAAYLLENGNLIRLCLPRDNPTFRGGGIAGRVEIFNEDSVICVVACAGSKEPVVKAGAIKDLIEMGFGPPLHSLVIPSKLHFMEIDALVKLAGLPKELAKKLQKI